MFALASYNTCEVEGFSQRWEFTFATVLMEFVGYIMVYLLRVLLCGSVEIGVGGLCGMVNRIVVSGKLMFVIKYCGIVKRL